MTTTATIDDLAGLAGVSDWLEITRDQIDTCGASTGDEQWIHLDVERAKAESPFGGTVAHGYLTLSLLVPLWEQLLVVTDAAMTVNYGGLDRVRFPAPVPSGAKVRLSATVKQVHDVAGGVQVIGSHHATRGQRQARLHRRARLPLLPLTRPSGRPSRRSFSGADPAHPVLPLGEPVQISRDLAHHIKVCTSATSCYATEAPSMAAPCVAGTAAVEPLDVCLRLPPFEVVDAAGIEDVSGNGELEAAGRRARLLDDAYAAV